MKKQIHILGGGTFSYIRTHLALSAPAFGNTAKNLYNLIYNQVLSSDYNVNLHLTKMADSSSKLVTNEDVEDLVQELVANPSTKIIFFNAAMCDFYGSVGDVVSGKYAKRLETREGEEVIDITPSRKIISNIRKHRKDIFLVGFKTTCNASELEQYSKGLRLLKNTSCNLVLANDVGNHRNMIIVPEEAKYGITDNRDEVLRELVDITLHRSKLHYTRSTMVDGESIDWNGQDIPESLRVVVNHCIKQGAYKPFNNKTAGHFAFKVDDTTILTSKRATNFNNLDTVGLVKVESTGRDNVIAYGSKPSVGGMSQRIIFTDHPTEDCIVHFHCPPRPEYFTKGSVRPQKYFECGSHECGENTSNGLIEFEEGIKAVYLDEHGPNIVFNKNINPTKVITFIDKYFNLAEKTGGMV